ncbi:MAG: hypothetical protein QE271_00100 [Bacteriovoracaceae bacterium]|nr:hypothetical protein [Bacteriovoracaceae bacterium]
MLVPFIFLFFYSSGAFGQIDNDLSESCKNKVLTFESFQYSNDLKITHLKKTIYEKSNYFEGFPRIASVKIDTRDENEVSSVIKNGTNLEIIPLYNQDNTELHKLLPPIAQLYTNQFAPKDSDANCHGATVNWFNNTARLNYISEEEIYFYLKENFNVISQYEEIKFGDVLLIEGGAKNEKGEIEYTIPLHTAIYISSHLFWNKGSFSHLDPWTFEFLNKQIDFYCKQFSGNINFRFYRKK